MLAYGLISLYLNFKTKLIEEKDKEQINEFMNTKNYIGYFLKGFGLNFINIGVLGFWLGILLTFGPKFDMASYRLISFLSYNSNRSTIDIMLLVVIILCLISSIR